METFGSHATGIRRGEAVRSVDGCSGLFRLPNGQDRERPTSGHATACPRKANGRDVLDWREDSATQRGAAGRQRNRQSTCGLVTTLPSGGLLIGKELSSETGCGRVRSRGETDAGTAGTQPARDNLAEASKRREGGGAIRLHRHRSRRPVFLLAVHQPCTRFRQAVGRSPSTAHFPAISHPSL